MNKRIAYLETLALSVVAFNLNIKIMLSLHACLVNNFYPFKFWVTRDILLTFYGSILTIAAVSSFLMIRYHGHTLAVGCLGWIRLVRKETNMICRWFFITSQMKQSISWLAFMIAIGTVLRCYFLEQPMRYDESYTFLEFVNENFLRMFYYPLPNNHVLHTLLVRISVELFGSHPIAIRLPAFLAGIVVIPLTFGLSRLLMPDRTLGGFFAALLVAVFPYMVLFDTMARGYSLLVLLSICLAVLGVRLVERPSKVSCFLMSLIIALGLLDIPTFIFPASGLLLWILAILIIKGHKILWVFAHIFTPLLLMTIGLTGLFYTPVILASNGIGSLVSNRYVKSLPWYEFLNSLPHHASMVANQFTRDIPTPLIIGVLVIVAMGLYSSFQRRQWCALTLLPALVIGGMVVLFSKHSIPFPRTWIYFLPFIFISADLGLTAIAKNSQFFVKSLLLLLGGFSALVIMNRNLISLYPDTGSFPEASKIVNTLSAEMNWGDKIVAKVPADAPVKFYMWHNNVPREEIKSEGAIVSKTFYIVKPSLYSLADLTKHNAHRLIKTGDAELYVAEM